ncbi:unnamed protein product [Rangifer tarandus platyrhynchus]|uniref:Uncharacterized protein n=1 Tax=Rangifer tarandus platyrhynchus TaxID=3082113 RepID=A0ABN8Z184_RANTA|nr:unnamed protein product [Rangifer tarandus platyrhynchus]
MRDKLRKGPQGLGEGGAAPDEGEASSPASPVSKAAAGPAGSVPSDPALSQAPGDSAFSSVRTSFASSAYQEALASVCTLPRCQMAELVFSVIFGRSWDPLVMSASGVGEESGGKRAVSLPVMSWSHLKAPSGSDGL